MSCMYDASVVVSYDCDCAGALQLRQIRHMPKYLLSRSWRKRLRKYYLIQVILGLSVSKADNGNIFCAPVCYGFCWLHNIKCSRGRPMFTCEEKQTRRHCAPPYYASGTPFQRHNTGFPGSNVCLSHIFHARFPIR